MRTRGRATIPTVVAAILAATMITAVGMQEPVAAVTTDTSTGARLIVNGLDAVVGPATDETVPTGEQATRLPSEFRARVLVQNLGDEPLEGLRLVLTIHEHATSRSALRAALDTTSTANLGTIERIATDEPIDPIAPGRFAQVEVSVDAQEAGLITADDDVVVHPVVLSVARGVSALDEVRTAAVGVSRQVARPLETVAVAPLDAPAPATGTTPDPAAPLLPGGRLDRLLRALEAAPTGAATAAPAPHAVEDLTRLVDEAVPGATDMIARLRAVVDERANGIVSTPYALADVPALTSSSATQELATSAIVAGRQRLPQLLEVVPDAAHLLLSTQTADSLDLAPADVLVMPWDDTAGPDIDANPSADIPPPLRTSRSSSGRGLDVLIGDPWVTRLLAGATGTHGWAVDAHRVVAETAMTFAQAPGQDGRAFVVTPPQGWMAPGRLADEVYARLAAAPWLRLADPVTIAGRADVTAPYQPADAVEAERTVLLNTVADIQDRLDGLSRAVADIEVRPDVVARGDDLLRAMTVWPTEDRLEQARTILDGVRTEVDEAIGEVVVRNDSQVTLASESGVIPVTVQHPTGVPMDVLVEVAAPAGLSFREGTSRPVRLEEEGTSTVSFPASALGRGTFPLRVTVRTPTGEVILTQSLVSVRASAVSRPALAVVAGVVLVLLVVGRLRRPRRPQLEVVS